MLGSGPLFSFELTLNVLMGLLLQTDWSILAITVLVLVLLLAPLLKYAKRTPKT